MDKKVFADPPAAYRPLPFWAWNDTLEPERIREQVQHMHRIGLGGFFMHSRQGLVTPYLSDEWMNAVEAAVDEAEKLGMEAWLYDEDRYPSGTAGGLALEANPSAFAAKHLVHVDTDTISSVPGTVVARFAYIPFTSQDVKVRKLSPTDGLAADERCLTFYWDTTPPSGWFNGFTYLDTLDPDAVKSFIKHGLEPYKERFAKEFGGRIPGVFTDEPQMYSQRTGAETSTWPWTVRFPVEFRRRRGYDLLEKLAGLVLNTKDARQVRYDFWKTATELFLETWCQLISRWCEENGLQWTGHYWEHEFPYFHKTGSFMAPLAYFHVPGVDLLGGRKYIGRLPGNAIQQQMGNVQMIKLASSVAHQTGKKRLLSETYGGAMSDMSFLDQKIMADWEMALGVNLINPHLYHYSIRGLRKRDYPPSWGAHQPWSEEYKPLADYLARVCYALSEGEFVASIAVLHPTTVFWVDGFGQQEVARAFEDLCKDLTENNWDYDLADETMLETMGSVKGGTLSIGEAAYDVVILPSHTVLAPATVKLLKEFVNQGGAVLALGQAPKAVCQEDQQTLDKVLGAVKTARDWSELERQLEAAARRTVTVDFEAKRQGQPHEDGPRPRIYSQVRKSDGHLMVFLANVGEEDCPSASVTIAHRGPVVAMDLQTGAVCPVRYSQSGGNINVQLRFLQGESYLLLLGENVETMVCDGAKPINDYVVAGSRSLPLSGEWKVRPLNPNPLVLDYCCYRIGDSEWSDAMPIWDAYCRIRAHYGLAASLNNRDVQPWRKRQDRHPLTADDPIQLKLSFVVKNLTARKGPVKLVVESGEKYQITVNDKAVEPTGETWLDAAFAAFEIGGCLVEGENTIILTTTFNEELEIENSFVIGDFTVSPGAIGRPNTADFAPSRLTVGDWTVQGYPFYAGKMEYSNTFTWNGSDAVVLEIGKLQGHSVAVCVNGSEVGHIAYPPYQLDITRWLSPGKNSLKLTVTNSLRNLTDPLHHVEIAFIAGPETFSSRDNWQDTYNLVPQGIDGIQVKIAEKR